MRDLSSQTTFRQHNAHSFDKIISRVIKSTDWDNKLDEIKDWQKEQEMLKNQGTLDDIGPGIDYNEVTEMTPEEKAHQFAQTKRTEYGIEVDKIRQKLGVNQRSQFGGMDQNPNMVPRTNQNILSRWINFGKFGKSLSTLEIENNKKLLNGARDSGQGSFIDGNISQGVSIKETPAQQEFRMNNEDWKSYLFSYKLSGFFTALSIIDWAGGLNVLFTPGYYPLLASVLSLSFISYKLMGFNDGPLNGNYFGSEDNLNKYKIAFKQHQEQEKQAKENELNQQDNNNSDQKSDPNNTDQNDDLYNENNLDDYKEIDSVDYNNDDSINANNNDNQDLPNQEKYNEDSKLKEDPIKHLEPKEFKDDGTSIPPSNINVNDNKDLYEHEEEFLKMVYRNRADLSKHLNTPYDILKVFAPLIVNFNKEFADTKTVSRDSWEFKNICYLIGNTYQQMSTKFRNAGTGKDAQYDPDYYFFVDEIEETGLFYKIKIRLPDCITRENMLKNIDLMKNNLRVSNNDVVDIGTELPNNVGYLKIYKITTSKDGKNAFLPLVSTGDVMRFNGMKTIAGKPLIEDLNTPDDLKILMGLSNAENALTLDIAGDQNTSIAIAGFTGSGKTASTGSWLTNILVTHSPDEVGFIIVDPKSGSFWENFRLSPHVLGYFDGKEVDKVPSMMGILKGVEIARQDHLNKDVHAKNYYEARKYFKSKGNWEMVKKVPRLFIVMDEQLSLISSLMNIDGNRNAINKSLPQKERKFAGFFESYKSQVGGLANIVREGGMTIMALSQRTIDKAFPRSLLSASSIKFMMKLQFTTDAEKLLGEGAEYPDPTSLPTGSGYLMANGLKLTQLTTPLFSGNPDRLEEVTRIIALAWAIIYDYNHDLNTEPPYYYLSEQSKENAKAMQSQEIDLYNVFNRDKIFKDVKSILRGEQKLHFDPEYETNFSIDLDKDSNQQSDVSLRDTNPDKLKYNLNQDDSNIQTKYFAENNLSNNQNNNNNSENVDQINNQNHIDENGSFNFDQYDLSKNDSLNEDSQESSSNNSLNNPSKLDDNLNNNNEIPEDLSFNNLINRNISTSTSNSNDKLTSYEKTNLSYNQNMNDAHKEQYENEYLKEASNNNFNEQNNINNSNQNIKYSNDDSFKPNNNILNGNFTEIDQDNKDDLDNTNQDIIDSSNQDNKDDLDNTNQDIIDSNNQNNKDDLNNTNQDIIDSNNQDNKDDLDNANQDIINLNNQNKKNNIDNTNQDIIDSNNQNNKNNLDNTNQDIIDSNNQNKSNLFNKSNQNDSIIIPNQTNNIQNINKNNIKKNNEINNSELNNEINNSNQKYQDNPSEIINFFKDNNINVIKTKELLKFFTFKTITSAISKNLITIDAHKNEVKINYH